MKPRKSLLVWFALIALLAAACGSGDSGDGGESGTGDTGTGGTSVSGAAEPKLVEPFDPAPPGGVTRIPGKAGNYNYSPAVMDEGNVVKAWWCSASAAQATDQIWYQEYDKATKKYSKLQPVLDPGGTPGDWDTFGVCHPSVIKGSWPGGPGGQNFTYAMYYTSTGEDAGGGTNNSTGVIFSTDGIKWSGQHARHNPMIKQKVATVRDTYGAGLPAAISNGGSAVTLFWIDTTWEPRVANPGRNPANYASRAVYATSQDGINFSEPKVVSQVGAPAYWKNDFAIDDSVQPAVVYSAQGLVFREGAEGEKSETYNFGIYRIRLDELLAGGGVWETLGMIDTNLTGTPLNLEPGMVRTPEGKVVGSPTKDGIDIWWGGGSGLPISWQMRAAKFRPGPARLPLRHYRSEAGSSWTTTGFVAAAYRGEGSGPKPVDLGVLDLTSGAGQVPLYGCQVGKLKTNNDGELDGPADRFVSLDAKCEGATVLGLNGYVFSEQPPGVKTRPLHSCQGPQGRFVSNDPGCDGQTAKALLGYARES